METGQCRVLRGPQATWVRGLRCGCEGTWFGGKALAQPGLTTGMGAQTHKSQL